MYYSKNDIDQIDEANIVSELPDSIVSNGEWDELKDVEIPDHLKDNVEKNELNHRKFNDQLFWQKIPYFKDVSYEEFMDRKFQNSNSVTGMIRIMILCASSLSL